MKPLSLLQIGLLFLPFTLSVEAADFPLARYDVVWESPSREPIDSMPLGNGVTGVNAWVNQAGKLSFYVARSDSWSANHILYKLGLVEISFEGRSRAELIEGFRQSSDLASGAIRVQLGTGDKAIHLTLWFDAAAEDPGYGVLNAHSRTPFEMRVDGIIWRTQPETIPPTRRNPGPNSPANKAYHAAFGTTPVVFDADTRMDPMANAIGWYHWNSRSIFEENLEMQGLEGWLERGKDPLMHLGSGVVIGGTAFQPDGSSRLRTRQPSQSFDLFIYTLTEQGATEGAFVDKLRDGFATLEKADPKERWIAHTAWWDAFWKRSWIEINPGEEDELEVLGVPIQSGNVPLRLGGDQSGARVMQGDIAQVRIYDRALPADAVAELAEMFDRGVLASERPTVHYDFERKITAGHLGRAGSIDIAGGVPIGSGGGVTVGGGGDQQFASFDGKGVMQSSPITQFGLVNELTVEAWLRLDQITEPGTVLLDQAGDDFGTLDGFRLSLNSKGRLQMETANGVVTSDNVFPTGEDWVHVAATYSAYDGSTRIFLDGVEVAATTEMGDGLADWQQKSLQRIQALPVRSAEFRVTQAYLAQRAMNAYAGRSLYPIKFNGSIFTVPSPQEFNLGRTPDHRKWGGAYWFQNTRLAYWPMLASGDFDLMRVMLDFYADMLPFYRFRTEEYYGIRNAAQYLEMTYIWGGSPVAAYGANRGDLPKSTILNHAHRYHFNAGLELSAMLLDYYFFTKDNDYLKATVIPVVDAVITYFMTKYPREDSGQVRFEPSQAMESYHDTVNPLPDVAGLKWALESLLALDTDLASSADRARWSSWLAELPPIPKRVIDGAEVFSPAEIMRRPAGNFENPEMYAVFPFRFYGVGKPDIETARETFRHRRVTGNYGWDQGAIQSAYLGLTDLAWNQVKRRSAMVHGDARWPAMWQTGLNHQPDQDHAGVFQTALQRMLIQSERDVIHLLPSWPLDKDVRFRLKAQGDTTIELDYRDGKVQELIVTPESRRESIVLPEQIQ